MNLLEEFKKKNFEWRFCEGMDKAQRELYFALRDSVKSKRNDIISGGRRIGKTFILSRLSEEFGIPVLVHSAQSKRLNEKENPRAEYIIPHGASLVGRESEIILCDNFGMISHNPHIPKGQKFVGFY